jgi:hypothetical protein
MRRNADLNAGLAVLSEAGIRDVAVVYGAKHLQLRWAHNGQPRMVTVPCTASDLRSSLNTRAEVRKLLRLDGLLPETGGSSAPAKAPCWREQMKTISHQLHRVCVPHELVAERDQLVVALRQLMDFDGPLAVANGKEAITK